MQQKPAKPRPATLPARDEVAALASTGGDADLARELLSALIAELPVELAGLKACLERDDTTGLAEQAHQVRGGTRYCGVPALDEAVEALERAARGGDRAHILSAFGLVEREVRRLSASVG